MLSLLNLWLGSIGIFVNQAVGCLIEVVDDPRTQQGNMLEILSRKVHPWKWGSENSYVNLTNRLGTALRDNPHLRVLVMEGGCDLATPPDGIRYSLNQMTDAPESALKRSSHTQYHAGHMFYLNLPDLKKARKDLADFITAD